MFSNKPSRNVEDFAKLRLLQFYDFNVYLSDLLIGLYALNDKFHDTMENEILLNDNECN